MLTAKTIRITCEGAATAPLDAFENFQGKLKTLSKERYEMLRREIIDLGFSEPISIWRHEGKFKILNGHQRVTALRRMQREGFEIPPLPVSFVQAESIAEAKRKVLALTSQYGEITAQGLYEFMSDTDITIAEVENSFIFPELDMTTLREDFFSQGDTSSDKDEQMPPAPEKPIVAFGQIFELGAHRLMCGDAMQRQTIQALLGHDLADCVVTDPPYGIGYKSPSGEGLTVRGDYPVIAGDTEPFDPKCLFGWAEKVVAWGGNHYADKLPASPAWLVWDKREGDAINKNSDCELAWSNCGGSARLLHHKWNGMIKASERTEKRMHPTQKPIVLTEWVFKIIKAGTNVLDLFGGSGSTLIACEKTDRRCFMLEIDPFYAQVIIERWCLFTGKDAYRLEPTGHRTSWARLKAEAVEQAMLQKEAVPMTSVAAVQTNTLMS